MELVLWVDQNLFLTNLLERVFKARGMPLYTISKVPDLQYLVEDLRPSLIVLDRQTIQAERGEFERQYAASDRLRTTLFAAVGGDLGLGISVAFELELPLDPFQVPDQIAGCLERVGARIKNP